jgi:hypothetical protein
VIVIVVEPSQFVLASLALWMVPNSTSEAVITRDGHETLHAETETFPPETRRFKIWPRQDQDVPFRDKSKTRRQDAVSRQ